MEVKITSYGGIITSMKVGNKDGSFTDVVLGHDSLEPYLQDNPYLGCLVGRYANRIAGGRFTLDGEQIVLARNDEPNHLHGGIRGFDKVVWEPEIIENEEGGCLQLRYLSQDGEEGFPGNLVVTVVYSLNDRNEFTIDYKGETDKKTVVCLTQHSYFNLGENETVLDHRLVLNGSRFTPVDPVYIPTGEILDVQNTQLDLTTPVRIGDAISVSDEYLLEGGFDHNFVLDGELYDLKLAAVVEEETSGIRMTVHTTEPAVQLYTGNFLDGTITGKQGEVYGKYAGFCIEAQHYPNSPNERSFPSTILDPGEVYIQKTVYGFELCSEEPAEESAV